MFTAQPLCRVVRPSIALPVFLDATCGVVRRLRYDWTKPFSSQSLPHPTVRRHPRLGSSSSSHNPASRSAVLLA